MASALKETSIFQKELDTIDLEECLFANTVVIWMAMVSYIIAKGYN